MAQTHDAAAYSETADLRGGEPAAGRADGFVVTIRTPAGHEHPFRVESSERVATVTDGAVAYFVAQHELAAGKYTLALLRDGQPEDLTATARLEDYGVHEGDVLVLIVGEPQVDG
jgi:hypothetical protein